MFENQSKLWVLDLKKSGKEEQLLEWDKSTKKLFISLQNTFGSFCETNKEVNLKTPAKLWLCMKCNRNEKNVKVVMVLYKPTFNVEKKSSEGAEIRVLNINCGFFW